MTTYVALRKERRKDFINATELNRKSGVAEWRDLQFALLSSHTPLRPMETPHQNSLGENMSIHSLHYIRLGRIGSLGQLRVQGK
jgi:hypothetical protein